MIKKINRVVLLILIILILNMGCINEKNEKNTHPEIANISDVNFYISTDSNVYNSSSKSIILTVNIKNIVSKPITIDSKFDINSTLKLIIKSPNNETLWYEHYNSDYIRIEYTLQPNEKKIFRIDLKNHYITNQNGTKEWDWNTTGLYSLRAIYESHIYLESNVVIFEIRK